MHKPETTEFNHASLLESLSQAGAGLVPDRTARRLLDTPYHVAPNEPVAQEAFAVIREAMRHKSMVALGRLVLSKPSG